MIAVASTRPWNSMLAERLAVRLGQPVRAIISKDDLAAERLQREGIQTIFFPHWSHLIPAEVFTQYECVIFHMTDLPFGRGGSPLQNLIKRGKSETVISALRCTAEVDAGPIYLKRPLSLLGTAEEIFLRADGIIEEMIVDIVRQRPEPTPQVGAVVAFSRLTRGDGSLEACDSLDRFYDLVRMLDADGYPRAFLEVGPFRLEFSRASRKADALLADVTIRLRQQGKTES